jgi:hypothetical protein
MFRPSGHEPGWSRRGDRSRPRLGATVLSAVPGRRDPWFPHLTAAGPAVFAGMRGVHGIRAKSEPVWNLGGLDHPHSPTCEVTAGVETSTASTPLYGKIRPRVGGGCLRRGFVGRLGTIGPDPPRGGTRRSGSRHRPGMCPDLAGRLAVTGFPGAAGMPRTPVTRLPWSRGLAESEHRGWRPRALRPGRVVGRPAGCCVTWRMFWPRVCWPVTPAVP